MTGQTVSPRSRAATISPTSAISCCSTTSKTSSTVRPEAAMRARRAALTCAMAAGMSAGACSQCGSGGSAAVSGCVTATLFLGRLHYLDEYKRPWLSRQGPLLEFGREPAQAFARTASLADRRARPARAHAAAAGDPGRARHRHRPRAQRPPPPGRPKPAVGESVRRLAEAGVVETTGERTAGGRGRGRVGSYYALAASGGTALAVSIAPAG